MSNSEIADTLSYLTDEQLLSHIEEEGVRAVEQCVALERTKQRRRRLYEAKLARGLA